MHRPDQPGPFRRRGPRPLLLHLLPTPPPCWPASPISNASLQTSPAGLDPTLLAGIAAYRRHPYQRTLIDPAVVWEEGECRLLDYGNGRSGPPVLFVPSLVNRAYVLDLAPGRSMMRWLANQGVRPLLLDWGWPGPAERGFTLTDYVAGRLFRALDTVNEPAVLAGYCMGGMLAMAAALLRPAAVRGLALLASPWDFHAADAMRARRLGEMLPLYDPVLDATGTLPVDSIQALFALAEPGAVAAKYRAFAGFDQSSAAAASFVALEDWLNDGVPLAAPVARETLGGWYGANTPARGVWQVADRPVDPSALDTPTFIAIPDRDRIVPPEGALPLARLIPRAVLHRSPAGHIGMAAGPRAEAALWAPLLGWLRGL